MGQAKNRGTFEQRQKEAKERDTAAFLVASQKYLEDSAAQVKRNQEERMARMKSDMVVVKASQPGRMMNRAALVAALTAIAPIIIVDREHE